MSFYESIRVLERQALSDNSSGIVSAVNVGGGRGRGSKKRAADDGSSSRKDRSTFSESDWYNLSKLYSCLEEHDIVRGLYERFSKQQDTLDALHSELLGDFHKAIKLYEGLRKGYDNDSMAEGEASPLEVDLWDQGIRDCLEGLQMWDDLRVWIEGEMEISSDIRHTSSVEIWQPNRRKELGLYLQCFIGKAGKESFKDKERVDTESGIELANIVFDNLFDVTGKLEFKKQALELDFTSEAALGLMLDYKQLQENRFDIVKAGLDLVNRGYGRFLQKWACSETLGPVVKQSMLRELQKLVEIEEFLKFSSSPQHSQDSCKELLVAWENRLPRKQFDDSNQWSQLLSCRLALLPQIKGVKAQVPLDQAVSNIYLTLSALARRRGNYSVALEWINRAEMMDKRSLKLQISHLKLQRMMASACEPLLTLPMEESAPSENRLDLAKLLALQGNILSTKPGETNEAYERYTQAVAIAQELSGESLCQGRLNLGKIGGIFMKFANFCNQQLQDPGQDVVKALNYPNAFVENMLRAIELGTRKAQSHFPRVLEIANKFPESRSIFMEGCKDIPLPAILQWLPQIFSELSCASKRGDKEFKNSLMPLLSRFAVDFPQAVFLSLRVVRDVVFKGKEETSFMEHAGINTATRNGLESFCRSLQLLQDPEEQLKDFLKCPDPLDYKELYEDCFLESNPALGQKRSKFAKAMRDNGVLKDLGDKGKFTSAKIDRIKLEEKMKRSLPMPSKISRQPLLHFSTELANFEGSSVYGEQLVVPGQTFDITFPSREAEGVKIVSYDPTLLTLDSMRKPKRLIMRGSDGKEYWWLVKNGEDLRQDERVQQVFRAMNQVLISNAHCAQVGLSNVTYAVIPISKSAGVIEWVQKTRPIGDVVDSQLAIMGPNIRTTAQTELSKLYPKLDNYKQALEKDKDPEDLCSKFEAICSQIPSNALRIAILRLASNAKVLETKFKTHTILLSVLTFFFNRWSLKCEAGMQDLWHVFLLRTTFWA
jgi:DNA-dependent protein kinase catalytic subunit